MARCAAVSALALSVLLAGPGRAALVRAQDYDAFWLWGAVKPQPALAAARTLYMLQGDVVAPGRRDGEGLLVAQGGAIPSGRRETIWLAYRAETLRWSAPVLEQMLARLRRWRAAGDQAVGLQIDFDARTRHLADYARFLADLRKRLPADCRLSITGLLDWSSQGDPAALSALGAAVDEVVLQTYQGRRTLPGYGAYMARLGRVAIPFRIGLVEGGEWTAPRSLADDPWFRGYVVFLKNPEAIPPSPAPTASQAAPR